MGRVNWSHNSGRIDSEGGGPPQEAAAEEEEEVKEPGEEQADEDVEEPAAEPCRVRTAVCDSPTVNPLPSLYSRAPFLSATGAFARRPRCPSCSLSTFLPSTPLFLPLTSKANVCWLGAGPRRRADISTARHGASGAGAAPHGQEACVFGFNSLGFPPCLHAPPDNNKSPPVVRKSNHP